MGVQQAFAERVSGRAATQDQVIAILDLRKEPPMLTTRWLAFGVREERREVGQPLWAAAQPIFRGEGIGECLQSLRIPAL